MSTQASKTRAIVRASRPTDAILLSGDPSAVAKRLKLMIVGGRKLTDDEAMALAVYSIGIGANPLEGEAYYLPGTGPGPGIALYRRRAAEQLWYEAEQSGTTGEAMQYWFEHVYFTEPGIDFDPAKGDIKVRAILHDSLTKSAWEKRIIGNAIKIQSQAKDVPFSEAFELATRMEGPEPTWSAEAIVDHRESFVKDTDRDGKPIPAEKQKPDKWNRSERCEKRAEKWALRKRFNLTIPEPAGWDVQGDIIDGEATEVEQPKHTEAENLARLGFDSSAPKTNGTPNYSEEQLFQVVIDAKLAMNVFEAKGMLYKCRVGWDTPEKAIAWARIYRAKRDEGKSSDEAAAIANGAPDPQLPLPLDVPPAP